MPIGRESEQRIMICRRELRRRCHAQGKTDNQKIGGPNSEDTLQKKVVVIENPLMEKRIATPEFPIAQLEKCIVFP